MLLVKLLTSLSRVINIFKNELEKNLFVTVSHNDEQEQKRISWTKMVRALANVSASAGAMGIGLKLYRSFSMAFLTNTVVVVPIFPNVWDALFLTLSGAALTILHINEMIPRN
jgi:hypothetical protein